MSISQIGHKGEYVYFTDRSRGRVCYATLCSAPFLSTESSLLPPAVFEKWREVLFWVPSPYLPSLRMFCPISRLLLKLAF